MHADPGECGRPGLKDHAHEVDQGVDQGRLTGGRCSIHSVGTKRRQSLIGLAIAPLIPLHMVTPHILDATYT